MQAVPQCQTALLTPAENCGQQTRESSLLLCKSSFALLSRNQYNEGAPSSLCLCTGKQQNWVPLILGTQTTRMAKVS